MRVAESFSVSLSSLAIISLSWKYLDRLRHARFPAVGGVELIEIARDALLQLRPPPCDIGLGKVLVEII